MRFQQVIAVVTRNVVVATVREIEAARAFVGAYRLHLWLNRMPLGSPNHLSDLMSPDDFAALMSSDEPRAIASRSSSNFIKRQRHRPRCRLPASQTVTNAVATGVNFGWPWLVVRFDRRAANADDQTNQQNDNDPGCKIHWHLMPLILTRGGFVLAVR